MLLLLVFFVLGTLCSCIGHTQTVGVHVRNVSCLTYIIGRHCLYADVYTRQTTSVPILTTIHDYWWLYAAVIFDDLSILTKMLKTQHDLDFLSLRSISLALIISVNEIVWRRTSKSALKGARYCVHMNLWHGVLGLWAPFILQRQCYHLMSRYWYVRFGGWWG
jgi:hypothetical protein